MRRSDVMFSVILPLYNKAAYVQRALSSVLAQGVAVQEVLVVNDGSTDGGEEIARGQTDSRVRVIDQPNRGVGAARNRGIAEASRPYLAFLDADDLWLPGYLTHVRAMIEAYPEAVLYGTGFATVCGGREVRRYGVRRRALRGGTGGGVGRCAAPPVFGPVDFFREWTTGHVIHTSSTVVPRSAAEAVGGFPEGVTHGEDLEFWARLALAGRVVLSTEVLTHYDTGVPGQAVEYWREGYRRELPVLPYYRFLAAELKRRREGARPEGAAPERSFARYCRKMFAKALLQRVYRRQWAAVAAFWRELDLGGGGNR